MSGAGDPKAERVPFRSTATIYSGVGHPFKPGETVHLPPDHVADLTKAGLEHVEPEPVAAELTQPAAGKSAKKAGDAG